MSWATRTAWKCGTANASSAASTAWRLGRLFCGESMFSAESGGSKIALVALARLLHEMDYPLLDTQVSNPHTLGLGAIEMPRAVFLSEVARLTNLPGLPGSWADLTSQLLQPCTGT